MYDDGAFGTHYGYHAYVQSLAIILNEVAFHL
jgi:hypothetical protein